MYARRVAGKELTFDFAEGLWKNNLLIVDRETDSVWSQLHGKAVIGPMQGTPLEVIPSMQTTWKFWRERYPDTRVMVLAGTEGRPYLYRNRPPGSARKAGRPRRHDTSALGLGVVVGEASWFFPFRELGRRPTPVRVQIGRKSVHVFYRKEALTAWAEDEDGTLLPGVLAYREGWLEFHPDSNVFR